jgi:probable selenate reductase FAD-binding subunit
MVNMLPKLNQYHRPDRPEDALALLNQSGAVPLAGGTTLLATPDSQLEQVVDLQELQWRTISAEANWLRLGSLATLADVASADLLLGAAGDLLRQAALRAGPNTYRNAATLGGLIASRPEASELLAALLVLRAELVLAGSPPESVPLEQYLAEPRGLIEAIRLPWPQEGRGAAQSIGRTPADTPIVHVVAWVAGADARLAAGGVGPQVLRLTQAEQIWEGGAGEAAAAAEAAVAEVAPQGDFRGSAEYRQAMLGVLVKRALAQCAAMEA